MEKELSENLKNFAAVWKRVEKKQDKPDIRIMPGRNKKRGCKRYIPGCDR